MRQLDTRVDIDERTEENPGEGSCRLRVWVSKASEGQDPNVFITEVMPPRHNDEETSIRFSHIASPTDIEQYPVETPGEGGFYYRSRGADLLFDSPAQAGEFMDIVRSHIEMLERSEALLAGEPTREEEIDV